MIAVFITAARLHMIMFSFNGKHSRKPLHSGPQRPLAPGPAQRNAFRRTDIGFAVGPISRGDSSTRPPRATEWTPRPVSAFQAGDRPTRRTPPDQDMRAWQAIESRSPGPIEVVGSEDHTTSTVRCCNSARQSKTEHPPLHSGAKCWEERNPRFAVFGNHSAGTLTSPVPCIGEQ